MACKIEIKQNLENEIAKKAIGLDVAKKEIAQQEANKINKSYKFNVISIQNGDNEYTNKVVINVPTELVDKYHAYFTSLEQKEAVNIQIEDAERMGEEYSDDYMFQKEEMSMSKASPETISKIKEIVKKSGIDIQKLSDYLKGNPNISSKGINGLADLVRGVIAIAEGKEDVVLTEEFVHIASAMIEQTTPSMITEMISKIDRFSIYKRTLEAYKGNKDYQLNNGKPDIRKIKREAVDKLITELIINKNEGNTEFPELREETNRSVIRVWWDKILDSIRGIYKKVNIDIFQETANKISEGELGNVADLNSNEIYYQQVKDAQKPIVDKLLQDQDRIVKVSDKKSDDILAEDEADNHYEIETPEGEMRRIKNRVTDRVKKIYERLFKGKTFTEAEQKFNESKRVAGVLFHSYMEEIHDRWFNSDGTKKTTITDRPDMSSYNKEVYNYLENYFSDLIDVLTKENNGETPLIFSELKVYDPKKDEAGTIDFLAIDSKGKGHILDWKFMSIKDGAKDVPWYKREAYDIQLGRYKDILKEQYGLKEVGMIRAIPAIMRMKFNEKTNEWMVNGLVIGSADVNKITDLKLLPVSQRSESTGIARFDKAISTLNSILSKIKSSKVTDESSRQFKNERLNTLASALRFMQTQQNMTPLIESISLIRQEGDNILNDWNTNWKDRGFKSILSKEKSEIARKMHDYLEVAAAFEEIEDLIRKVIYDKEEAKKATTEEDKADFSRRRKIVEDLRSEIEDITESRKEIEDISKEFANKFMGWANNIPDLLEPEAILKGLGATFDNISRFSHTAFQILNRLITDATLTANRKALISVNKLLDIKKQLIDAGNIRDIMGQLYQRDDKGNHMNRLIYKYSPEFYNKLTENAKLDKPSKKWLEDNIDIENYKKKADQWIADHTIRYQNDYKHDETTARGLIEDLKQKFDITNNHFNGWDNWMLKQYPLDKWLSKEYLDIQTNKPLAELYDMIWNMNHKAADIGYIDHRVVNMFLPFLRKSFAEKVAWNENPLEMMCWESKLRVNADDTGFGKVDELNGGYIHTIPKYFTHDFTKSGEKASEDIFKNLILYFSHVEKYEELSNLEGQIELLQDVESLKDHLDTNWFGKVRRTEQGKPRKIKGNEDNVKVLDKFVRVLLYGEKYVSDDSDIALNIHPQEGMKKIINSIAGHEVYKVDENPDPISLTKVIDTINQYFRVKTLGGNFVSGAAVMFGSSMQVMEQAGRYFTASEFRKNIAQVFRNKLDMQEKEIFAQLVETFMPLRESIIDEKLRGAGMSAMTNLDLKHKLMIVMSFPSNVIEQGIFLSLLENSMIENGKIVNIREFVNAKYTNKTSSPEAFKETSEKIKNEITELKETRSINVIKKLENGKLVIPGLDLTNIPELDRLTKLTRRIGETSTHGRTSSDANQSAMNIWLNSMMVFKTWMPKLISTRFGALKKVADDFSVEIDENGFTTGEKYDMGRISLFMHTMGFNIFKGALRIRNILSMNENGIKALEEMFEKYSKDYESRTGKTLNITRDDFFQMIRENLHNEVRELATLLLLTSIMFSTGFFAPGDPRDKAAKNKVAYSIKVLRKFHDQLGMFYNPIEWAKVLNGGIFPAIGIFTDIGKFVEHLTLMFTGLDIAHPTKSRDEVIKKAQPAKYLLEVFPTGKAFMTYMSMFNSDFAKYYDVNISSQNLK